MNRRDLILQELGLLPQWVRRGAAVSAGADVATLVEQTVAEKTASSSAAAFEGTAVFESGVFESAVFARDTAFEAERPTQRATVAAVMAAPAVDSDRAAQIARFDWTQLQNAVKACTACALHATRKQTVFGVGGEQADWLFIGEGPGAEEDARGEPFVGQAGKLLDNMLAAIGLKRGHDVYIANIVKCRPPSNRQPEPVEATQCQPYLTRQIQLLQPKLVIALGRTAAGNLLRNDASIGSLRGRLHSLHGIPLIVTYHPAYLLRTLGDKAKAWEDLCFARETMQRLKGAQTAQS
ncbi:MAG: uracil-DNA glycosylase family protein [Betaproteobacteria bacterium]